MRRVLPGDCHAPSAGLCNEGLRFFLYASAQEAVTVADGIGRGDRSRHYDGAEALRQRPSRPGNRDAYDFEHQAGLLALELENSRINSNARLQKISYERLFIENKRKSIRHFD